MSAEDYNVSVVICSFWDGISTRSLLKAIHSLLKQRTNLKFEIIIIEQGPKKEDINQFYLAKISKIPIIHMHSLKRLGIAMARKRGILLSRSPLIAFLDDDCVASEDWLEKITKPFRNPNSNIVGAGGTTLSYSPDSIVARFCDVDKAQRTPIFDKNGTIISILTVNACFKKNALEKVEYFNPAYEKYYRLGLFPGFEDFDITQRLKAVFDSNSLAYIPEAVVFHKHPNTVLGRYQQYKYYGTGAYFWTFINNLPLNVLGGGYTLPPKPIIWRLGIIFLKSFPYQLKKFNEFKKIKNVSWGEKLFYVFMGFVQRFGFYAGCYLMCGKCKKKNP